MELSYSEYYDVITNFFKLNVNKLGDIFYVGSELDDYIDRKSIIIRNGGYYSYESNLGVQCERTNSIVIGFIRKNFIQSLYSNNYVSRGKYTFYKEDDKIYNKNENVFKIYKGFKNRIILLENEFYLCIDPACIIITIATIEDLINMGIYYNDLEGFSVKLYYENEYRINGYLIKTEKKNEKNYCTIRLYRISKDKDIADIIEIESDKVFPESRPELLESFLKKIGSDTSIIKIIREYSFLESATSSRDRLVETLKIKENIDKYVFPLQFGGFNITLSKEPTIVKM